MEDNRELKSFIILKKSTPNWEEMIRLNLPKEPFLHKEGKIRIQNHTPSDSDSIIDYEIWWETEREVISESLNNDGEILNKVDYIMKVAKISVWMYKESPYVIVFSRGVAITKLITFLSEIFKNQLLRVTFDDKFFKMILNSSPLTTVTQTTFKSANTEQEFSISGFSEKDYYSMIRDSYITEMQIAVDFECFYIKAKLTKMGRIALYNTPGEESVREFTKIITDLLYQAEYDEWRY